MHYFGRWDDPQGGCVSTRRSSARNVEKRPHVRGVVVPK
jgi:hypothetical protein